MGVIKRFENTLLNIETQLSDADRSLPLRVFTDLVKLDGTILKTIELTHISKGVFIDNSELMTNDKVLIVRHYVYFNDGITLDETYNVASDRYELDGLFDVRRAGFTTIKTSQESNAIIKIGQENTGIKVGLKSNIKINVIDNDITIDSDGNNTVLEV